MLTQGVIRLIVGGIIVSRLWLLIVDKTRNNLFPSCQVLILTTFRLLRILI